MFVYNVRVMAFKWTAVDKFDHVVEKVFFSYQSSNFSMNGKKRKV